MLNCFTDEEHNAVSQQIHLPPGAVSAFLRWQLMRTGQVLLYVQTVLGSVSYDPLGREHAPASAGQRR